MMYGLDVPAAVADGTDVLQITISGTFGAYLYAQSGSVVLPVGTLLAGSALCAHIGMRGTKSVDEDGIKGYFAVVLAGSAAVAAKNLGSAYAIKALNR